jgi:MFS family permease
MTELTRSRVAASTAFFLQGFVFASLLTQAPRIYDRVGLDTEDATFVILAVAIVSGFGSVIAGTIAARKSSGTALAVSLIGIALGAALIGVATTIPALFVTFAFYGLALGGVDAGMNMQGVRVQAAYGRSIINNFHAMWSTGAIVGAGYASLSGALDLAIPLSLGIVALLALAAALLAGRHFIPAREVDPGLVAEGLPWRPVLVFGTVILLFFAIDVGTQTWSTLYLDDTLLATAAVAPVGYALYQVGALLSRVMGDRMVESLGAPKVVIGGVIVGVCGFVLVLAAQSVPMAVVGLFIVGLGLAVLAPLSFAALAGAVPEHTMDVAIARMNIANYVGAILGGGTFGVVGGLIDLRWAWLVLVACAIPIVFTAKNFRAVHDLDSRA